MNTDSFKKTLFAQTPLFGNEIPLAQIKPGMHGILFTGGTCRGRFKIHQEKNGDLWAHEVSKFYPKGFICLKMADNPMLSVYPE